ncbi:hypothetical protein Bpfe_001426 [Biomphalaria pfeifferi]|uniref:Uncharacterized protein n=1 Tax=Biomphalaria pfeifferi TaxID=112525 RepID=A0AAD8FNC5_BIOPF|nr:hypothetical protein Bpfe_001426 [Biomphalaria pfeifferi]
MTSIKLKVELEWRRLKHFEKNKDILRARLWQALTDEGEDPETYLFLDEAEKDYVLETMATCGPTTVSRDVHGKGPLTQRLRTTTLESTVIATAPICVKWLAILTSSNSPCVSWLASTNIFMSSKQRPRYRLKRRLEEEKATSAENCADGFVGHRHPTVCGSHR